MASFRSLRSAGLLAALVGVTACSADSDSSSTRTPLTADILLQGGLTEVPLQQMVSIEPDNWGWAGGVFDAPASNPTATSAATVSGKRSFSFAWHADPTDPPSAAAGAAGVGDTGTPGFTGMAYLLVFASPANAKLLRIFTTATSYAPDTAAWKVLRAVNGPLTVTLTTATFEGDALTAEGGPHKGQTLILTIGR